MDSYQAIKEENSSFVQAISNLKKALNVKETELNSLKTECEGLKTANLKNEGQIDELQQKVVFTQRQLRETERRNENLDFLHEESLAKVAAAEQRLQESTASRVCIFTYEMHIRTCVDIL